MIDLVFRFSRDVAMATDFGKIVKMTFVQKAGVPKRFEICSSNLNMYILCKFDEDRSSYFKVTVIAVSFWTTRQNGHIAPNISENIGPIFTQFLLW